MSVVIVGGNECMECRYKQICKQYGHKAKVFVKEKGKKKKKMGCPDLLILFTGTVSHKMVHNAVTEAKRNNIAIARTRSASAAALRNVLEEHAADRLGCS